ncbi:hypothetical protein A3305_07180 [Rickettsia amblyommatis]|nr:hypothetical protein A3305_07180 [Rickettsia amblyommatis]
MITIWLSGAINYKNWLTVQTRAWYVSITEKRYFCLGTVDGNILTVRFTFRDNHIRIFRAGYWCKGKRIYE